MMCVFYCCSANPPLIEGTSYPMPGQVRPARHIAEHVVRGGEWFGVCPASYMTLPHGAEQRARLAAEAERFERMYADREEAERAAHAAGEGAGTSPEPIVSQAVGGQGGRPAVEASASWSGRDMTDEPGVTYAASSSGTTGGMGHGMASVEETKAALLGVENLVVEALSSLNFTIDKADEARNLAIAVLEGSSDVHIIVQLSGGIEKLREAQTSLQGAHGASESYRGSF